jgi:hypothetical protein
MEEVVTPEVHRKWEVEQDNRWFEHLLVSIHQSINYRPQFRLSDEYEYRVIANERRLYPGSPSSTAY